MDRLTEKFKDGRNILRKGITDIFHVGFGRFFEGEAIDKLAEYEDLEEQGKLLKLPVAVGTWVYEVYQFMDEGAWEIDVHKIKLEDLDEIGKTVFLTRPEAERVLAEMEVKK